MPFNFRKLDIPEVVLIEPKVFKDERGFFMEVFKKSDFAANGIEKGFVQSNHSKSSQNILRGLHFQNNPMAQGKCVRVISGEIFDVAVDVRKGSPTFGKWVGETLNDQNRHMLYIPEGFAHGFCVVSKEAEVVYYCTNVYSPEDERGLIWNDPQVGINWPVEEPVLSKKDAVNPTLDQIEANFTYDAK